MEPTAQDLRIFRKPLTDAGNAESLKELFGDRIRHCRGIGWLLKKGHIWAKDKDDLVYEYAVATARTRQKLVSDLQKADPDPDDECPEDEYLEDSKGKKNTKKKKMGLALRMENHGKITSCLSMAKPILAIPPEELDTDPLALGCPNGILNLKTGTLREAYPDEVITMTVLPDYDADALCPRFDKFLEEVFVKADGITPDHELIQYIQRVAGMFLTGYVERAFLILYGDGFNGKGAFIDILLAVLGDYGATTPMHTLMEKKYGNDQNYEMATLVGKRFVSASEAKEGMVLDEAKVKLITGNDQVNCRPIYEKPFTFTPKYNTLIQTNDKPVIKGTSHAIWGRVKLIPCYRRFSVEEGTLVPRNVLDAQLQAEKEGVLAWMVRGAMDYIEHGLRTCEAVDDSTKEYQLEQDTFARFLDESVTRDPNSFELTSAIAAAYNWWATNNYERKYGDPEMSTKKAGNEMTRRGYTPGQHPISKQRGYRVHLAKV
jgi:putative DNA primase/helicase